MQSPSPVNPIPPVVVLLCLIAVLVELVLSAGQFGLVADRQAIGWRIAAIEDYSVSPAVLDWIVTRRDYDLSLLQRFVTYPFVHATFTQALFGIALLLALGKFVGDVFGGLATAILFVVTTLCGALAFCLLADGRAPLYGLFPPVYGLIGAYTYVIWLHLGRTGQNQLAAFRLIGVLLALQLVYGLLFGVSNHWIAELAGFVAGFGAATLLVPGGWAALVARLRQRS